MHEYTPIYESVDYIIEWVYLKREVDRDFSDFFDSISTSYGFLMTEFNTNNSHTNKRYQELLSDKNNLHKNFKYSN